MENISHLCTVSIKYRIFDYHVSHLNLFDFSSIKFIFENHCRKIENEYSGCKIARHNWMAEKIKKIQDFILLIYT